MNHYQACEHHNLPSMWISQTESNIKSYAYLLKMLSFPESTQLHATPNDIILVNIQEETEREEI